MRPSFPTLTFPILPPLLLAALTAAAPAFGTSFTPLAPPGTATFSQALDISDDGTVVAGRATGSQAIRWVGGVPTSVATQYPGFGDVGLSGDGAVVVGTANLSSAPEAFRWENGTLAGLGLGGGTQSVAYATSGDGSIVVGYAGSEAYRWEVGVGEGGLGYLDGGGALSRAFGISSDGSVIVGRSDSALGNEAFRWENGVMLALGDVGGGLFDSRALAVSDDGTAIVGYGTWGASLENEALRWDGGVMTPLGFLGGDDVSQALDITGSGDIVVGFSQLESIQRTRATIWNEASQPLSIASILTREGIDLTGWTLTSATAVAADGRTVAGFGFNPDGQVQGWVAELPLVLIPEPSTALLLGLGLAVLGVARRH